MTRYTPSRNYLTAGLVAMAMAGFSGWCATRWTPTLVPAVLFCVSAGLLIFLALRPPIEIHTRHLRVGHRAIPWSDIRRVDLTGWTSPLIIHLTLEDESRMLLIYPGDLDSSMGLLRQLRRMAQDALIDGIPYREFWGEGGSAAGPARRKQAQPRYKLLRDEDEAEVERLYQRLKTVGHLDSKSGSDET